MAAVATKPDSTDPWTLRLLPEDFPAGDFVHNQGYGGNFVDLCEVLPVLGRHRAYMLQFGPGGNAIGRALDIVTRNTGVAQATFLQIDRLVAKLPWVTKVTKMAELPVTARIGQETRVFHIKVKDVVCSDLARRTDLPMDQGCTPTTYRYAADVVTWRKGQVIGMVVTSEGQNFGIALARAQLARSEHPTQ